MKVYVVVVNHHIGGTPNYRLNCKVFMDKQRALKYKEGKEHEFPVRWDGDYNHVEIFEREVKE